MGPNELGLLRKTQLSQAQPASLPSQDHSSSWPRSTRDRIFHTLSPTLWATRGHLDSQGLRAWSQVPYPGPSFQNQPCPPSSATTLPLQDYGAAGGGNSTLSFHCFYKKSQKGKIEMGTVASGDS